MDTSFPANQDAISQYSLIPYDAWNNPTIEAHNGGDPVPSNKFYCSWTDCSQSHKEHTAGELRFVRPILFIRSLCAKNQLESI
jgi:hypothetical protein